jgi:cytidylate kinase
VTKIIIAIDGYSSCGKSTLAKQLAKKIGYHYVDTGAMYRAVTLYLIRNQIDIHHPEMVAEVLPQIKISFGLDEQTQQQFTILNGENIENEIRVNPRVAGFVSGVSSISAVRRFLVHQQQEMGNHKGIVMDGRDIGTVVFPKAELKLFVTAEPKIRAQRRFDELAEKGQNTTFEEVLANLEKRDHMDTTRADSPLMKAEDAIELDNSNLSREEQLAWVLKLVEERKTAAGSE